MANRHNRPSKPAKPIDRILSLLKQISDEEANRLASVLLVFAAIKVDGNDPAHAVDLFAAAAKQTFQDMLSGKLPGFVEPEEEETK